MDFWGTVDRLVTGGVVEVSVYKCPSCGQRVTSEDRHCENCGDEVEETTRTVPIDDTAW